MMHQNAEFGKFRAFFWPIYRHESRKIVPMMLMLFLICLNYTILRNLKDTIVITAKDSGAEVIPFIKVWVLLPMAVLSTLIFTKLSSRYSQERVFYIMITFFLIFFAIFGFILYPKQHLFHPHELADHLGKVLPAGFKGMIAMFRNWTFTMFYVMCELWSTLVMTVLFWGLANEVTKISEARRFYSMLGLVASISGIIAGVVSNYLSVDGNWDLTLKTLLITIIVAGILTMATFYWMNKNVLNGPSFEELHHTKKEFKKKRLSIRESFTYLSNSRYLICIAILVMAYNLVINMVEIVWKDQLRQLYSSPLDYNNYMNTLSSMVGLFATCSSLFMSQFIARFGWTRTALITPVIMLVTSMGFFAFMLFRFDLAGPVFALTGTTPLVIAVFFGAAQVCLSKACKYSIFDSTKEMTFIPLDHESKLKGKAAIDGVGSRLGKSGGSLIHQGLLMVFASVSASAPYVAAILMAVIIVWMMAVRSLGKKFAAIVGEKGRAEIGEAASTSASVAAESNIASSTRTLDGTLQPAKG